MKYHLAQLNVAKMVAPLEDKIPVVEPLVPVPKDPRALLEASLESEGRWIRMAARALAAGPERDPEEELMERLLALQQVPLFEQLSLEQLEAVHRATPATSSTS